MDRKNLTISLRRCPLLFGLFLLTPLVLGGCQAIQERDLQTINLPIISNAEPGEEQDRDLSGDRETELGNLPGTVTTPRIVDLQGHTNLPIITNEYSTRSDQDPTLVTADLESLKVLNLPIITNQSILYDKGRLLFTTIEKISLLDNAQLYSSEQPGFAIIDSEEDAVSLGGLVSDGTRDWLEALDYERQFAMVVFAGIKPALEYGVTVDTLLRKDNTVYIETMLEEPESGAPVTQVISSPYHAIEIPKVGDWGQEITFYLVIDGDVVASQDRLIR